jgi:hypothetical protein
MAKDFFVVPLCRRGYQSLRLTDALSMIATNF